MAKIGTYPVDTTPNLNDKLIGTDVNNLDITKNYLIGDIVGLANANLSATQVLNGSSTVNQVPAALDEPLVVSFGAAQGTSQDDVMIDAQGKVTFNNSGIYFINGYGAVERFGSSGGTAIFLFRGVLNGTQITATKAFHIASVNVSTPYEVTIPFQATAGDEFYFEVMRDSTGVNAGGLYIKDTLGGWGTVPSSQIQIWKLS
jgi:hypothetical protein